MHAGPPRVGVTWFHRFALWPTLGCLLLLLALTGCVSGDGVRSSFKQRFADDPAVSRVDLSTVDNMAFTGGVSGTVFLHDSLSEPEVREFAERVREFSEENADNQSESQVRINLAVGAWTFPVLSTPTANDALLDLVQQLRADTRVGSGTLTSKDYREGISHATLIAAATKVMPALIADAPDAFAAAGMTPSFTLTSPADESGSVKLSGRLGAWAETAFHAYQSLRSEISLTSFHAEETAITVKLAHEADLDRAQSLTDEVVDPATTEVFYQSDLVTLFPGARGDRARNVLATLDASTRALLVSVWSNDSDATLTMNSSVGIQELAQMISANHGSISLDSVTLAVGQGDDLTLSLQAAPGDLATMTDTAMTLVSEDHVTGLRLKPGFSINLDLDAGTSHDDIVDQAPLLKQLSAFGERLCVDWTTSSFCAVTAPTIDANTIRGKGAEQGRAFADAWNSAR